MDVSEVEALNTKHLNPKPVCPACYEPSGRTSLNPQTLNLKRGSMQVWYNTTMLGTPAFCAAGLVISGIFWFVVGDIVYYAKI